MVGLSSKGADSVTTELCVTAPMDAAGFARPRVLLDVTDALRSLGVMVFKADIHSARSPGRPLLEVHRFLLTDLAGQPIVDPGELHAGSVRPSLACSPTACRAAHKARAARARQPAGLRHAVVMLSRVVAQPWHRSMALQDVRVPSASLCSGAQMHGCGMAARQPAVAVA